MKLMDKKWVTVLGLAMSLPSTILGTAYIAHLLVKNGFVSKPVGFGVFLLVVANIFFWMIWYALKNKNKS